MKTTKRREQASFEDRKMSKLMGGGTQLVSEQITQRFVQPTAPPYNDIANCIRANSALNATDNSLRIYERDLRIEPEQG